MKVPDDSAAQKAITELDQAIVKGRTIRVVEAKLRDDRPAKPLSNNFSRRNGGSFNNRF